MATTNLLSSILLANGDESAEVTIAESSERVNLRFQSVQLGSANSQARLVVVDDQTRVKATVVVDGNGTKEVEIERIDGALTVQAACNLGTCRVTLDEVTGTEGATGEGPGAGGVATGDLADDSVTTAKLAALAVTTAKLAALGVTTAKIAALAVTTAKLNAAAVTLPKMDFTGLKILTAPGRATAGTIALTGAAATDRILAMWGVFSSPAASNTPVVYTLTDFTVTGLDEITQGAGAGDTSAEDILFLLLPASA